MGGCLTLPPVEAPILFALYCLVTATVATVEIMQKIDVFDQPDTHRHGVAEKTILPSDPEKCQSG